MEINLYRELNFLYCIYASELPSVSSLYFILYINFWTKSSSHKLGGEDSLFLQHSSSTRVRRGQVVLTHSANIISPYYYKERHTTPRLNIISSPRGSSDRSPCSPAWGISVKIYVIDCVHTSDPQYHTSQMLLPPVETNSHSFSFKFCLDPQTTCFSGRFLQTARNSWKM